MFGYCQAIVKDKGIAYSIWVTKKTIVNRDNRDNSNRDLNVEFIGNYGT